jgi:hypothetical protein
MRDPGRRWGAAGAATRDAGRLGKARARPRAVSVSLREKGCEAVRHGLTLFMGRARTISKRTQINLCWCPSLTELEHGQTAGSAPQGPGVTGTVKSGRPPMGGPVRSDLKEPRPSRVTSSLRDYVPGITGTV